MEQRTEQGQKEKAKLFSKNERRVACLGIAVSVFVGTCYCLNLLLPQYAWITKIFAYSGLFMLAICAITILMKPLEKTAGKVKKTAGACLFYARHARDRIMICQPARTNTSVRTKIAPQARTRSHRSHARPSFANAGGNSAEDGSGSGDDLPGYRHLVTPPNPSENPNTKIYSWSHHGSCRVRKPFYRERGQAA